MIPLRVRRFWQTRRPYALGILLCFCVLGLVPAGYGQTDRVSQQISELKAEDAHARSNAARALGLTKDPRAVDPLIAALKDPDEGVRSTAAGALGKIHAPAVEPLIAALRDPDERVRSGAAYALGNIGDRRAVKPLIAALNDSDGGARRGAAWALGTMVEGPPNDLRAVEPLLAAARARDTAVIAGAVAFFYGRVSDDALIAALDESGDIRTAGFLLNCGNPKLEAAARRWAARKGYQIGGYRMQGR